MDIHNSSKSSIETLKRRARRRVEVLMPQLVKLASAIHGFAEVKFEEHRSCEALCVELTSLGFEVERRSGGLETAFVARRGSQHPAIAFIAEYDALPGIGHGCGHNLIGPAAIGAAEAVHELQADGSLPGSVAVIGTPAEEGGGGKVLMIENGVFSGFDAGMMVHPRNCSMPDHPTLALTSLVLEFFGKPSHAGIAPHEGVNALDAMVLTYSGLNALRQHIPDGTRVHGIITHGGAAVNVVPEYTRAEFSLRAPTASTLDDLYSRFVRCSEGAATATGCRHAVSRRHSYKPRRPNSTLNRLFTENLKALGREVSPAPEGGSKGSSDAGDVSQLMPFLHGFVGIEPHMVDFHTTEFCSAAVGEAAWGMVADGAKSMAGICIDLLSIIDNYKEARRDFDRSKSQ
jgi:amidohydrolase